jgi:hypothetical protein
MFRHAHISPFGDGRFGLARLRARNYNGFPYYFPIINIAETRNLAPHQEKKDKSKK